MDRGRFLTLDDEAVAIALGAGAEPCWAIAMGGTRRGYIAAGGTLVERDDLAAYFDWVDKAQCAVFDQLFRLGVRTLIAVDVLPADRGATYRTLAREALGRLSTTPARRELYRRHQVHVRVAGDQQALTEALGAPELIDTFETLARETAAATGPRLVHLFRGPWIETATEEAAFGYRLGHELERCPTRDELVEAYYGLALPPLTVYVGSGRPRIGQLRPPFLGGAEDCYWTQAPLMRLSPVEWRRIMVDHLYTRRTQGARAYAMDSESRRMLSGALAEADGHILGIGARHPLGFWHAETQPAPRD